jgi:transcriptional regulator with XRE-family HTH domain
MEQQNVGSFLKTLRREKNLTQEQLAEQLHVSGRTVSRWETGSNMPDISLLVALAEFYEVSIPEIIDGERKSETMNEEAKETALKLSDYAETVNRKLKTRLLWMTLAALVGMVVFAALDILGLHTPFYDFVAGVGLGLGYGMLAVLALYLSGILGQIKARRLMRREARSNI